jgi:hypothetical protein
VSDPTVPPGNPDEENLKSSLGDSPSPESPETESGPIDVQELLESTRRLFTPEELDKSLQQAGYTPELPVTPSSDTVEREEYGAPVTPAPPTSDETVAQNSEDPANSEMGGESSADTDQEESSSSELDTEGSDFDPRPRRGVNVLSVVAFVLAITLSPLAPLFGYIALGQTRRAHQRGELFAVWAIGIGWVVLAAWVVAIAALVWIGVERGITLESLWELVELFRIP